MKKFLTFIAFITLMLLWAACSSTTKFKVVSSGNHGKVHAHNTKKHAHGIPVRVNSK